MKLSKTILIYLLMTIPALLVFAIIKNQENMLIGFTIGIILGIIQILMLFFKVGLLIDTKVGTTRKNKVVISPTYWITPLVISSTFYLVLIKFGTAALLACFGATLLLKPTHYISHKNWKGGVK